MCCWAIGARGGSKQLKSDINFFPLKRGTGIYVATAQRREKILEGNYHYAFPGQWKIRYIFLVLLLGLFTQKDLVVRYIDQAIKHLSLPKGEPYAIIFSNLKLLSRHYQLQMTMIWSCCQDFIALEKFHCELASANPGVLKIAQIISKPYSLTYQKTMHTMQGHLSSYDPWVFISVTQYLVYIVFCSQFSYLLSQFSYLLSKL